MKPIYKPKTRAKEYADLAINIYTGCNHGCHYCYAKKNHDRWHPNESFADVKPRENIVEATRQQLSSGKYKDKTIMLCFTCDPYPAFIDTTPTREVIQAIKEAEAHVRILTKGGFRAKLDFDLLDSEDSLGVTVTEYTGKCFGIEPRAASTVERLDSLISAKEKGIKTWVSFEPVYNPNLVFEWIVNVKCIDLFKIGKLNYFPSNINWGEFGRECERLCKIHHRNYYIKDDLRAEMEV